jgi:hypothetical protein
MVVEAKDINKPPDFTVETMANAEVVLVILLVLSREKPTISSPSAITRAVVPVVAVSMSKHREGKPSPVPRTMISIGSIHSQHVMPVLVQLLGLQECLEILEEMFIVRERVASGPQ